MRLARLVHRCHGQPDEKGEAVSLSWLAPRRATAMILSAVVAGALCAVPASAAGASPATATKSANAGWQFSGPISSDVSLQAIEGPGDTVSNLFFFVSQQFCDVAHNQEVTRTFTGQQFVGPAFFSVSPHLAGAVLAVPAIQVTGSEDRLDGCSSPSGPPRTVSLGTSTVSLFASWKATGPIKVHQPGRTYRVASATGVELSTGLLDLGDLGPSKSAELDRSTF